MNRIAKIMTCAATIAAVAIPAAASAQYRTHRDRDRDHISTGEVIAGVAVLGGVAAIIAAQNRDNGRYGNNYGYRYRDNYVAAVNSCARYADRYGGRVRITDVDRRGNNRYRVSGVVEGGRNGRYDRYDRYDPYNRSGSYNRYGGNGYGNGFACTATEYGRITDFDLNGRDRY